MRVVRLAICAALLLARLYSQTFGLSPLGTQFFDNNGQPLAGGQMYFCIALNACPGTPLAAYADSTGFSPLPNPAPLDASGRLFAWLSVGATYKIVLQNSANVTVWTVDSVSAVAPNIGVPTTQYWNLTGNTIFNLNAGGTGPVKTGSDLQIGGNAIITGTLNLRDNSSGGAYAILRAPATMTGTTTWRWPPADAAGVLTSDGLGNLTFSPGGGGGGTPGGANTDVQFAQSSGGSLIFAGSSNFTWANSSQLLSVTASSTSTAGISVVTGYAQADQGFFANTTCTVWDCFHSGNGGVGAISITSSNYVQLGNHSGTPPLTTGDTFNPGAMYWDTSTHGLKVFNESSAWVSVATGGATSPGGSNGNVQINSIGSFGGSGTLTYGIPGNTNLLQATSIDTSHASIASVTGFIQSDQGFNATTGTCISFQCFNATTGGMYAKSFTAANYIGTGFSSTGVPPITTNDGFHYGYMYYDVTIGAEQVCTAATCTSSAGWASLSIGGGGGGTPGTPTNSVQVNNVGAFKGYSSFLWQNPGAGNNFLQITTVGVVAGLAIQNGFVQADGGFLATSGVCTSFQCFNAPTGGVGARSLTAIKYIQTGNNSGIPSASSSDTLTFGGMYFDTSLGVERLCTLSNCSSSGWVSLGTGGLSSLNGLTGAVNIVGTTNEITVVPSGSSITLATPQPLAGTSAVSFASVTTTSFVASNATGASLAFQGGSGTSQILGSGAASFTGVVAANGASGAITVPSDPTFNAISTLGGINTCSSGTCTGGQAMSVNGVGVVNSSRQWISGINTTAGIVTTAGISAAGFNPTGFTGATVTIVFSGGFTVGASTFHTMTFKGGVLVGVS